MAPRPLHSRRMLFSPRTDPYRGRENHTGCLSVHANVLGSITNYVRLQEGAGAFSTRSLATTYIVKKRAGVVRFATIEEIQAEKSLIENDAKARMEKTIEKMLANFNAVRTGRANPSMLDRVEVEYYGSPTSLKSLAQISTPDASTLLVQPYDKSSVEVIEKAIVSSDIGLTTNNDGEVIRLSIPQLTSVRRKELSKVVAKLAKEAKEKKLSEDNVKDLSSDLQKVTDVYLKKIDTTHKQKEKVHFKKPFHLCSVHVFHLGHLLYLTSSHTFVCIRLFLFN